MIYTTHASVPAGWERTKLLTMGFFWEGTAGTNPNYGDYDYILWDTDAIVSAINFNDRPIIIDIEFYDWETPGGWGDVDRQHREYWKDIIKTMRAAHGGDVGVYRMFPERNYADAIAGAGGNLTEAYMKWRARNRNVFDIAQELSTIYPSLYMDQGYTLAQHEPYLKENIREAFMYGKPVRPFISSRYRANPANPLIPMPDFVQMCQWVSAYGIKNICAFNSDEEDFGAYAEVLNEYFG